MDKVNWTMKAFVAYCLLSVFLASPAFAVYAGPRYVDTVRDAKTEELYRISVDPGSECREGNSKLSKRGFGFGVAMQYKLDRYISSKKPLNCPEGWSKQTFAGEDERFSRCTYPVSISPPLTFHSDTGENRKRHISKAERDSALKQCNEDLSWYPISLLLAGGGTGGTQKVPIPAFVYLDKAGKSHEITLKRIYSEKQERFVTWLYYSPDSEKCDRGWRLYEGYYIFCYYLVPEPPLFSPKKKLGKRH